MCDLWRFTTRSDTPIGAIPLQLSTARQTWRDRAEPVSRIKLYNASNFFDARAVPDADYPSIASHLDDLDQVIVESHPSLVGSRIETFLSALRGPALEVAMGLETTHPAALEALNKRMTTEDFARASEWLRARGVSIRVFLLIHPPFITVEEQDEWLVRSVDFAASCGASVISLIPTRGGNGAMEELARQKLFRAPTNEEVARSFDLVASRFPSSQPLAPCPRVFLDPWAAHAH
jgi:radical SAM enzyme (TIGR01210 family)